MSTGTTGRTYMGIPVHVSPHMLKTQPVLRLSDTFEWITDEGRESVNKWLLDMFGEKRIFLYHKDLGAIFVHPENMSLLEMNCEAQRII